MSNNRIIKWFSLHCCNKAFLHNSKRTNKTNQVQSKTVDLYIYNTRLSVCSNSLESCPLSRKISTFKAGSLKIFVSTILYFQKSTITMFYNYIFHGKFYIT